MKKIIMLGAFVFAFALTANVALGFSSFMPTSSSTAFTKTIINSSANTGGNTIMGNIATTNSNSFDWFRRSQTTCTTCGTNVIGTGSAESVVANVGTGVTVGGTGFVFGGGTSSAITKTMVNSSANTGDNGIVGNLGGTNTIVTGNAGSGVNMISTQVTVK